MKSTWVALAALVLLACSCAAPYTYLSYEVVRVLDHLSPGDEVHLVQKDGTEVRGTIVRVDDPHIDLSTSSGQVQVSWDDIRVLERLREARVTVD